MAPEREISWLALEEGTPVQSSDGEGLGQITNVVADDQKDIFSGIAFRSGVLGPSRFAPADAIEEMTPDRVVLKLHAAEVESLEEFQG